MKRPIQIFTLIACLQALGGCKTADIEPHFFPVTAQEIIGEQKIEITLKNTSMETMCIDVGNWPNNIGELHYGADILSVHIGLDIYPIFDSNHGYPTSYHAHRIEPGESLEGSIPYKLFGFPKEVRNAKKTLDFSPAALNCKRKR